MNERVAPVPSDAGVPIADRLRRDVDRVVQAIVARTRSVGDDRSTLVAVSGIDGSGKGFVSGLLARGLRQLGFRVALLNIDGWLALPHVRFSRTDPAGHFFRHAIRFDEMFEQLVLPLRDRRSIRIEADFAEETAAAYRRHLYEFADIDVIVLEGIYLLKREFRDRYDLSVWIDCGVETALARAVARAQEGLPPEETVAAYRTIYFPAQELHAAIDQPRRAATLRIDNEAAAGSAEAQPSVDEDDERVASL